MLQFESSLAASLKLRGAEVQLVVCGGPASACILREITIGLEVESWGESCESCVKSVKSSVEKFQLPLRTTSDFISDERVATLRALTSGITYDRLEELDTEPIAISSNIRSAIVRCLRGAEPRKHEQIVPEYALSGLVNAEASRNAIEEFKPTHVFMSHGIYVDWGPALHTALSAKIPVSTWRGAFLNRRYYFATHRDSDHTDGNRLPEDFLDKYLQEPLSEAQDSLLNDYIRARYEEGQTFDMRYAKSFKEPIESKNEKESARPKVVLFSHINWDGVCDYAPMVYETFNEWILDTLRAVATLEEADWVIKIHPAEEWENPETGTKNLIEKHFGQLPKHIKVMSASESVNPRAVFDDADVGVTVFGSAGLELALLGKPVILAGRAHYSGLGFTLDSSTKEEYRVLLKSAARAKPLDSKQTERARKYAYLYFLARQLPFPPVAFDETSWWHLPDSEAEDLCNGKNPFVDFICDELVGTSNFVMDENLIQAATSLQRLGS